MAGPIIPCLWFDGNGEEAARFYTAIFANSAVTSISHYGDNMPMPKGTPLLIEFNLDGQPFQALNGTPAFPHTQAISLSVTARDEGELDRIWDGLLADGGTPVQCGWLTDRFGISWQVIPAGLAEMQRSGSREQVQRMMEALMPMVKLDGAALRAAFEGVPQ
jgi:predicted 3-demethylubiquinone-9 3-methyltransferase (glyoxalase superfamily)